MGIAGDLIIIIVAGLIFGLIANRLKLPPIVGYIIAGIIIGPYTGGIAVSDIPQIEMLAEIGVALLLFSIGIEVSLSELKAVRGIALIGTPIQVILLTAAGILVGNAAGMPFKESAVLGMIISLSSTMVVLKTLMARGLIGTLSSRVMIGILIIQDLAAIPLMLIIPNLGPSGGDISHLFLTLLKAAVILAAIIIVGSRSVPWILRRIVLINSRELFLIAITALGLGVGFLTHAAGLSLAFGAFVAGLVISESDYSHQALDDIIPLRDIFGLVFFTSVGMLLDPSFILNNAGLIAAFVAVVIILKFIIFFILGMSFRYFNVVPLALGLGLSQIGEFSFVLARTALKSGVITEGSYSLMLSVSVATMIVSPFLSMLTDPLYKLKKRRFGHEEIQTKNLPDEGLSGHIIIAGGGRVGFQIASIYMRTRFPFIVIEQDFHRFEKCRDSGFPAIYGDASSEGVLHAAGINKARLVILTIPFTATARAITSEVRRNSAEVKIIARADDAEGVNELFSMKLMEVVQPEFEASLEIVRKSMMLLDVPPNTIYEFTDELRKQNYSTFMADEIGDSTVENIARGECFLDISWLGVKADSPLSGRKPGELEIRSETGISIVGVLRDGSFISNPDADFIFKEGDYVAVIGRQDEKDLFSETFLNLHKESAPNS